MNVDTQQNNHSNKKIATWIFVGVAMLIVQILLGGITRLTGSGLSITEWKPIMGFLPPLNEMQWQQAFEKYQSIAQYKYINNHFTVTDFKFIFFWEWFHRLWARLIAVAFAIPFVYFIVKKHIAKNMIKPLIILVLLGALEGAVGWIMVKSGLNDENVYVNHIKLSIHFIIAMFIISYAVVFGLSLVVAPHKKIHSVTLKKITISIIVVIAIQLIYGAFMAGLKAAAAAPTWPTINGKIIPSLFGYSIKDILFFNNISIHFIHRTLAYIILILIIFWYIKSRTHNTSSIFNTTKKISLLLVIAQLILGISAVLLSPKIVLGSFGTFEYIALLHQLIGMLLLLSFMANVYLIKAK